MVAVDMSEYDPQFGYQGSLFDKTLFEKYFYFFPALTNSIVNATNHSVNNRVGKGAFR